MWLWVKDFYTLGGVYNLDFVSGLLLMGYMETKFSQL